MNHRCSTHRSVVARHAIAIAVAALVTLISFGATGCSSGSDQQALPDLELDTLDGGTYDLIQTGRPRVLNLWATWCAPCRAELPVFDAVAAVVDDVEIIGVNTGDAGADAAELAAELGLHFPQVLDPKAQVQTTLRITGMPSTIFVDASGAIVEIHSGELERSELEALLTEHFATTFDQ